MNKSFFNNQSDEEPSGAIPDLESESEFKIGKTDDAFKTDDGRLAAIMAYIPFLCFIPLLNMKDNKEARFHARQGVMLFLIEIIEVVFLIDNISDFVFKAVLIVAAAFSVAGIYFGLQGKNYRLPIISDLADKSKL
jgi:fumarate reductase subunit D